MDEASQGVMVDLVGQLAESPGLLCITRRDRGRRAEAEAGAHVRDLELGPLTRDQAAAA